MFEATDGRSSPHPPPGRCAWARARPRSARCASPPPPSPRRAGAVRARPRATPARAPPPPAGARPRCCRRPRRFDLLGLVLGRAATPQAQVRARADGGRWTRWTPLPHNHGGDRDRTDPVFTGSADEFQLRLRGGARGLRARFVRALPHAPARRARAAARQAARPRSSRARTGAPTASRRAAAPATATCRPRSCTTRSPRSTTRPRNRPAIILGIARYHRDSNGWNDIGYNFLVDRYGVIFEGRAGGVEAAVDRRPGAGLQQPLDRHRLPRHVHQPAARRARDGVAGAADRLEALAARRAGARPGHARVRRRREQPLPERDAGDLRARQRPSRRRRDLLPRRGALRAAAGAARPRLPASPSPSRRSPCAASTQRGTQPAAVSGVAALRRRLLARAAPRSASSTWPAGSAWTQITTTDLRARRRWATSVTLPASGQVRAVFAGDGARGRLESAPVTVRVVPSMSLTSDKRRAKAGTSFAVSGTLAPSQPRVRVPARAPGRLALGAASSASASTSAAGASRPRCGRRRPGSIASRSSPTA